MRITDCRLQTGSKIQTESKMQNADYKCFNVYRNVSISQMLTRNRVTRANRSESLPSG